MANNVCVNKSGNKFPVYDDVYFSKKIGTIYNGEVYVAEGSEGHIQTITFRNSSGRIDGGYIDLGDVDSSGMDTIINYPYKYERIDGVEYPVFKFRRSEKIYRTDGSYWGSVAAGQYVATFSDTAGSSHPHWMVIDYVRSTSGSWVRVDENNNRYGFVNIGLEDGSTNSNMSMYGNF